MAHKIFKFLLIFSLILNICDCKESKDDLEWLSRYVVDNNFDEFSLLFNITCATAKDELEKHPEMRTIAMVELENNFPAEFSREVLKCLPSDVAKIQLNPHTHMDQNSSMILPKQTLVIYIADVVELSDTFAFQWINYFERNFPVVHHLSKILIVSDFNPKKLMRGHRIVLEFLNVAQIYQSEQVVFARGFDVRTNSTYIKNFEHSQDENLSQILFPDKAKNLNGKDIFVVWTESNEVFRYKIGKRPNNKWMPFLNIIEERMNASMKFVRFLVDDSSYNALFNSTDAKLKRIINDRKLDFSLNYMNKKLELESYHNVEWCFMAPLPEPYSITDQILFMPMDNSCWMWLGITIAVCTFVWRISEGHWGFAYGAFSYFMGQAQLIIRIKTNRLTMKILLQLLIFAIFIFSNGYQSLVTSFMLNPMQQKLLTSADEIFDSDLLIQDDWRFKHLYGDNPKFRKVKEDQRIIDVEDFNDMFTKMVDKNYARLIDCTQKMFINYQGDGKSYQKVYLIDEVAAVAQEDLYTRPFHPYLDSFQDIMDRSFEAGLHQAWERFYWEIWRDEYQNRTKSEPEKDILEFKEIIPFFLILAFGLSAALLGLFCEIFWKDFVSELSKEYFKRKKDEIFGKKKEKRTKVKVKRIQVKPVGDRKSPIKIRLKRKENLS